MNRLRKLELLFISTLFVIGINAQRGMSKVPATPQIWHRPDSAIICPKSCDSISLPTSYTMMMVYKSLQPEKAQQLWKINRTDNKYYSISTHAMSTEKAVMLLRRTKKTFKPCIYTFQQTLKPDTSYQDITQLFFGTDNTQDTSSIILYEAAYFDYRLPLLQSLMFQTYLAIKNGITLDGASYISTHGDTIWDAKLSKDFYNRIHGFCSDTIYNYISTYSISAEDSIISIYTNDTLPKNSYILIGDNNADLDWKQYDGNFALLQRMWKMSVTGSINNPIYIKVNFDSFYQNVSDTLYLITLDQDYNIIRKQKPDSIYNMCSYYTITPHHNMYFSFGSMFEHQLKKERGNLNKKDRNSLSITPNPTDGDFIASIHLEEEKSITITIKDMTGKTIHYQTLGNVRDYLYNGRINTPGLYIISLSDDKWNVIASTELIVY